MAERRRPYTLRGIEMERNYIVVDLGTGNSRVALVSSTGKIYAVKSFENTYHKDEMYEDAQYFLPEEWEKLIVKGCRELCEEYPERKVSAVISSGARESIVLFDKDRKAFLGLPNIDNRGREWVKDIPDKEYIYERTGRWVTEDFPAAKLLGLRKKHPGLYYRTEKITSLSEWIGEIFTGKIVIEPSQACETQLFDIETLGWSQRICSYYEIKKEVLPDIQKAGSSLGTIKEEMCEKLLLPVNTEFIIGGADTQVAVKGSNIFAGDVGIVSGTTSPVITIVDDKYYDKEERCWTDCNLGGDNYQVETNPGVTGLNYQRFKKIFFENTSYEELDRLMSEKEEFLCTASFSSLYFSKKQSLKKGGFVMGAPFDAALDTTDLLWALVGDIACSIYVQYESLCGMIPHEKDYILGCGGGLQSEVLCQMIADLTGKELIIYEGFEQASIYGCAKICNEYFEISNEKSKGKEKHFEPRTGSLIQKYYPVWLANRQMLNPMV